VKDSYFLPSNMFSKLLKKCTLQKISLLGDTGTWQNKGSHRSWVLGPWSWGLDESATRGIALHAANTSTTGIPTRVLPFWPVSWAAANATACLNLCLSCFWPRPKIKTAKKPKQRRRTYLEAVKSRTFFPSRANENGQILWMGLITKAKQ